MTNVELHSILNDKDRKLSKKELIQIILELKYDSLELADKYKNNNPIVYKYSMGEVNSYMISLLLIEKLEEK